MKKRIIIDTDMGGDDYIAIQLAILSKKFHIDGITLVHGNTSMQNIKKNVFKTLDMIGMNQKIKVYQGEENPLKDFSVSTKDEAFGGNGFSDVKYEDVGGTMEEKNAVDYLIETVNQNPNRITLVALGPLTNIAKAIKKDASFASNIKELIVMGGGEHFGNITPYAEFNFYNDPEAVRIVYSAGIERIVTIGFDIATKVVMHSKIEEFMKNSSDKNANFIYNITRDTAKLDKKYGGAVISDSLVICYLLDPNCALTKKVHMEIELSDKTRLGQSIVSDKKDSNCEIVTDIIPKKVYKRLLYTLFKKEKKELKKFL